MRRDDGFVAIEWVAAIALLLLPVVVLVATLPTWAERRHAATVAAREAARELVDEWPNASEADAVRVAKEVAADHGVNDVDVVVDAINVARGADVRVDVTIVMPAISVAGIRAGSWRYRAHAERRVDDYRSR